MHYYPYLLFIGTIRLEEKMKSLVEAKMKAFVEFLTLIPNPTKH